MSDTLWPHGLQHARLLCPPLSLGVCSNSCSLSQWCYLTISSSATPFSFCLQSFPTSGSLHIRWPNIGTLVSASVLPMSSQGQFPLGLTGLISLQSKGLSRFFSSIIQKHQLFSAHPSLCLLHCWRCINMLSVSVFLLHIMLSLQVQEV